MHLGHPEARGGICHKMPTAQVCPFGVTGALHDVGRHLPLLEDRAGILGPKRVGEYQRALLTATNPFNPG